MHFKVFCGELILVPGTLYFKTIQSGIGLRKYISKSLVWSINTIYTAVKVHHNHKVYKYKFKAASMRNSYVA